MIDVRNNCDISYWLHLYFLKFRAKVVDSIRIILILESYFDHPNQLFYKLVGLNVSFEIESVAIRTFFLEADRFRDRKLVFMRKEQTQSNEV